MVSSNVVRAISPLLFPVLCLACNNASSPTEASLDGEVSNTHSALTSCNPIRVSVEVEVTAAARSVWETVGDFNGWSKFSPAVTLSRMTGQGVGAIRVASVTGVPGQVIEREDLYDPSTMMLAYSILESPLPVDQYHSLMNVRAVTGSTCKVKWSSVFVPKGSSSPAEAESAVRELINSGLANIQALFVPKVTVQKLIATSPEVVWNVVGDFGAWDTFLPPVTSSHLVTSGLTTLRMLTVAGSDIPIVERLDGIDDSAMSLSYGIVSSADPSFDSYASTIKIVPQGNSSLVIWSGSYRPIGDPAVAHNFFTGLYTLGLDTLSALLAP
jgi:mxaD protein